MSNQYLIEPYSQSLLDLFLDAILEFWFVSNSDHAAMFHTLSQVEQDSKPFRLYDSWLKDQEFLTLARVETDKPICGKGCRILLMRLGVISEYGDDFIGTLIGPIMSH